MFDLKVDGLERLLRKFEKFDAQLQELHKQVPQQMVEWQTSDMRRKYPNIQIDETPELVEATTMVWPRSRLEQEPGFKRPYQPPTKGPRLVRPKGVGRQPASMRPILRHELLKKLYDRCERSASEAMKWP